MKKKLSFFICLILTLFLAGSNIKALPDNTTSDGYLWDGIDFKEMVGSNVYYGAINHATEISYANGDGLAVENAVPRESQKTPILWEIMGDEGDGQLSVLSKYVLDGRKYNNMQYSSQATSNFAVSRTRVWLNSQTSNGSTTGLITDGFLYSFTNDDGAEYYGLFKGPVVTKLYDRYDGKEYTYDTYQPYDWTSGGFYYQPKFPYTSNIIAYLPWGFAGGANGGVGFSTFGSFPHANSGKLYWNASSTIDDTQLIGSAKDNNLGATLKNGIRAYYWTGTANAYDNGIYNAYGDNKTYGWREDAHSIYPLLVTKQADYEGNDGTIIANYDATSVLGVRPIVKIQPKRVLMMHEITNVAPLNAGQLNIADKVEGSTSWNYEASTATKNYKLTVLNEAISLNKLKQNTTELTSGVSTLSGVVGQTITLDSINYTGEYLAYKIVVKNADGSRSIVSYGTNKDASDLSKLPVALVNSMSDNSNLTDGKDYTVYVWSQKEDVKDIHSFEGSQVWHFKLGVTKAVAVPPIVTSVDPYGTGISILKDTLTATFSKEMDKTSGVITLNNDATLTNGVWSEDGKSITYELADLDYDTTYTYTFTDFVDIENNPLVIPNPSYTFTTDTPPVVSNADPLGNNISVFKDSLSVTFSKEMDKTTGVITLDNGATLTNGVWSEDGKTITYDLADLDYDTTYTYTFTNFEDVVGNPLVIPDPSYTFTTDTPPVVTSADPLGEDISVFKDSLSVNFSKEMDKTTGVITLDNGATLTNGVWSEDGKTITYDLADLDYDTTYTYTFTNFKDVVGNPLVIPDPSYTFTTDTPPIVTSADPLGSGIEVTKDKLTVTFSKEMDKTTGVITLDNGAILSNGIWSEDGKTITYDLANLDYETTYTYTFTGFEDVAGNPLVIPNPGYTFTTIAKVNTSNPENPVTPVKPDNPSKPDVIINKEKLPQSGNNKIVIALTFTTSSLFSIFASFYSKNNIK